MAETGQAVADDTRLGEDHISIEEQVRIAQEIAAEKVPEKTTANLDAVVDATVSRELEQLRLEEGRFEFQQRRARLFSMSGLFAQKDVTGQMALAQAMVKIELGESMGFTPAESLQGIYVINGVTSIAAALRAARMQAAGYDWRIDWLGTEDECTGCRLWLYKHGKPVMKPQTDESGKIITQDGKPVMVQVSEAFTIKDATRMLTTIYVDNPQFPGDFKKRTRKRVSILEKDNWQMSPRNLYFARAVTNLQRFHAPAVLNINIASREELEDGTIFDENGRASADHTETQEPRGSIAAAASVADEKLRKIGIQRDTGEEVSDHKPGKQKGFDL